jgi:hypothetical protein
MCQQSGVEGPSLFAANCVQPVRKGQSKTGQGRAVSMLVGWCSSWCCLHGRVPSTNYRVCALCKKECLPLIAPMSFMWCMMTSPSCLHVPLAPVSGRGFHTLPRKALKTHTCCRVIGGFVTSHAVLCCAESPTACRLYRWKLLQSHGRGTLCCAVLC